MDPTETDALYRDRSLPTDKRVADLLDRMTLEEKAVQLCAPFAVSTPDALQWAHLGLGGLGWPVAAAHHFPRDAARFTNEVQAKIVNESRHGIPALIDEEALCGLKVAGATIFPDAIGQAATWDPELIEEMGAAIGRHMSAIGVRQVLSPLCDVARDPRWGRIEETYGEDPYLVGCMATAFVKGVQNVPPGHVATLKHFVAYSASDGGRNTHPAQVGIRELREVYALPFEMAIRLAGARSVMCSYNQLDRVPVQGSRELITGLLKEELGFEGIVISDLGSVEQLQSAHGVAADQPGAEALALRAGLDLQLSDGVPAANIIEAVQTGQLDEAEVDRAVSTLLSWKIRLGLFDDPYVDADGAPESLDSPQDRALARRTALASIVLLHNTADTPQPLLPLGEGVRSLAVIGPTANRPLSLLGNYSYPVLDSAVLRLREVMNPESRDGQGDAEAEEAGPGGGKLWADAAVQRVESVEVVSVLEGIRAAAAGRAEVRYAPGCPVEAPRREGIAEAVQLAADCDAAVVVVGDQSGIFTAATVGEGVDSTTCELPGVQRELVEAVAATGTPTVVVLTHGRPLVLDWMVDKVAAILSAWFPGEEGGSAIAAVLFGDENPGGKLPASFPRHSGALPTTYNRTFTRGDNYYDGASAPVFPFGHGLSYTTFAYSALAFDTEAVGTDGAVRISCRVANTGGRGGDEVVQLYLHDPVARSARPRRELKGFKRVHLEPGEEREVVFVLAAERCAIYDPQEGWVVEPGDIEVMIGSSSEDIRLSGSFAITGPARRAGAERALVTPVEVM